MRKIAFLFFVACNDPPSASSTSARPLISPTASVTSIRAWKPHKLARVDASAFCAELIEGGIAQECAADPKASAFTISGRQRTEARGSIVWFGSGGDMATWLADSFKSDGGVDPVYHYSASAKMLVSFSGDVPEETRLRVAEALDAL